MFAIPFPAIDPVAIEIGPLAIRWYALAYVAGLLIGWRYVAWLVRLDPPVMERRHVDDLLVWMTLGIILGGRLGYVLFYRPGFYLENPEQILMVWQGGMAFHGGLIGAVVAIALFARGRGVSMLRVGDVVTCAAPIGIFFGRVANFINAELWGRPADVPWAVVFPTAGPMPRHPSQLYEAVLEGLVLAIVLFVLARRKEIRARPGLLAGVFFVGYAVARIFSEFFREPDAFLGFLVFGTTMGQVLSVPLLVLGIWLIRYARRHPPVSSTAGSAGA